MAKEGRDRKVNVKEKFGDYLMDISKYVLTGIIVTTVFNDMISQKLLVVIFGLVVTMSTLLIALFKFYK